MRSDVTSYLRDYFGSLWTAPDPVLAEAGVAGELLVAKVRLSLATLLLCIPVINSLFFRWTRKKDWWGSASHREFFFCR